MYVRSFSSHRPEWLPAYVSENTGPVSYKVTLEHSRIVYRRHIDTMHPMYDGHAPVCGRGLA